MIARPDPFTYDPFTYTLATTQHPLSIKKVEKDSIMGPGIGNTVIQSIPNLFNDHLFERLFLQQA
jgi:hypothetical protein